MKRKDELTAEARMAIAFVDAVEVVVILALVAGVGVGLVKLVGLIVRAIG